jgi:hypothetical protein
MSDLYNATGVFETSTRLQSASIALSKLSSGKNLDSNAEEALRFAGKLLSQFPWNSTGSGVSGGLTVEATEARPAFLASLRRIRPQFEEEGLHKDRELRSFLASLNRMLVSGGTEKPLKGARARLGANLLSELAHDLLMRLKQERQTSTSPVRL